MKGNSLGTLRVQIYSSY